MQREFANTLRRHRASYEEAVYWFRMARAEVGLDRSPAKVTLPQVLTQSQVEEFLEVVARTGNVAHELAFRLLASTGLRVAELVALKKEDVDVAQCRLRVVQGKGGKDRIVLFPEALRIPLRLYLQSLPPEQVYLFETERLKRPWSTRWVNKLCHAYGEEAGIPQMRPHLFRHHTLTRLTQAKLSAAQIKLLSGHSTQKSLEVYQHLALADVEEDYQEAMVRRPRGKR
jgi:integrase/recombinase XerD